MYGVYQSMIALLQSLSHLQLAHFFFSPLHLRIQGAVPDKHAGYQIYVKPQTGNDCIWMELL